MRKILVRIAACFAAPIVLLAAWLAFQWLPPRPKLVVSRETTWITEPLLPDGTVDYEGAWRKERSVGLTPENNAGPYLFAAVGVESSRFSDEDRAALPKDVARFAAFYEWYYEHAKTLPEDLRDRYSEAGPLVEALESGTTDGSAARLAELWFDANSSSLAEIERCVKRDHMIASGVFHDAGPAWMLFEIYSAFHARAALAAANGDLDAALDRLAPGLRLARLQRSLGIIAQLLAAEAGEAFVWESALRLARRAGRVSTGAVRILLESADPSGVDSRLRARVTAERMQHLDFLVHPVPLSLSEHAEPTFYDWLIGRIDANRACRRLNDSADRVESAWCTGTWDERLDRVEKLQQQFLDDRASLRSDAASLWVFRSRDAFGDLFVDYVLSKGPRSQLESMLTAILQSERALIELAALAFATESGHDPKSSDDLTPLLFEKPWRDRVTGSGVTFERQADGTLVARGPLIDLQTRFEEWSKRPSSPRAH